MIRRIETVEEREAKEKKRTRILVGVMLVLLLGSTAGYSFLSGDNENTNNGDDSSQARNVGGQWAVPFNGKTLYFSSSPESTKNISVIMTNSLNNYQNQPLYISSADQKVSYEISSTLGQYTQRVQLACYGNCSNDLPEKDCNSSMIVYNQSNQNTVLQQDNCIFINGDIDAVDAFLYKIFGIN